MRVCILHDKYYRGSGSSIVIRRIVEALQGSDVEFFFAGCSQSASQDSYDEDLDWIPDGHYRRFDLMTVGPRLVVELRRFSQWLADSKCDLVHAHHRRLAALSNVIGRINGVPVVYTAHNTFAPAIWFWMLAPNIVTGVSNSVLRYLDTCTRSKSKHLVWNPLPFERYSTARKKDGFASRAVAIGRLEPVKGHVHLINAWSKLRSMGVTARLEIYGEGSSHSELVSRVRAERLEELVTFHGFTKKVPEIFDRALFNILVSATEGFPNVVVEAAATGTASVLTDVDGNRDCLPHDGTLPNGVEYGNVLQLADTLAIWFRAPDQVIEEGQLFRRGLAARCSTETVRRQYREVYASAIRNDRVSKQR